MPFIFPNPLPIKDLSKSTTSAYKHLLNKISKIDLENPINTIELLQSSRNKDVIDYISKLGEPDVNKRRYYSAIFWILKDTGFLTPNNPYRLANREIQDRKEVKEEDEDYIYIKVDFSVEYPTGYKKVLKTVEEKIIEQK